jgi:ribosomal-protein-serine acetyltransferase
MTQARPARVSDHRILVDCVQRWWADSRTADEARELSLLLPKLFLQYFADTSLVLEDDAGIRAFLVGFYAPYNDVDAYIHFVAVHPQLRGQGVGRSLYTTFSQRAAEAGRRQIHAVTSPGNTQSIAFHQALGFALQEGDRHLGGVPVHSDYDGPGQDRVCFHKRIAPTAAQQSVASRTRHALVCRQLGDDAELRPLEPWQAAEFAARLQRLRGSLKPWIPWADTIVDEASARNFLQHYASRQAADSGRIFGIYVSGVLQGHIVYRNFDTEHRTCEIGGWLAPDVRGRGLFTSAAQVLIDWAINVRGMVRVEWRCNPRNQPSIATAARIGFTYEGTHRKASYVHGEYRDVQIWAIT